MSQSVSFDRAAGIYDETRALPEEVASKLTDTLLRELSAAGAGSVLEVGIGTGRIARPLMAYGIRVRGADISLAMMTALRDRLGPEQMPPDLVLGDAVSLPFASNSVPAVLMVHILHLVSSMKESANEVVRVLKQGGVLLHENTRYPGESPWQPSIDLWNEIIDATGFARRVRPQPEEIRAALERRGGTLRIVPYASYEERRTPQANLDRIRDRIDSWSWEVPDDLFAEVYAAFEPKYRAHYVDMKRPLVDTHVHELEVWTFP